MKQYDRKNAVNFWQSLPRPFFVLAPMANVTDSVFRRMIAKYAKPDVMWTEFVSADGLISPGRKILLHDLKYSEAERPIVAQLFTGHPEAMKKAATLVADLGFDGLDINMGCPDRAVEKQGGGAGMIKNPKDAVAVIEAAREGVRKSAKCKVQSVKLQVNQLRYPLRQGFGGQEGFVGQEMGKINSGGIPVTVKTRLGYNQIDWGWIRTLLEQKLPALTIHLRTRKEMSEVPAHWELMPEIVKLRDEVSPETLIIGNGDVNNLVDAIEKTKKYDCDGVMIGRGIFGMPWLFSEIRNSKHEIRDKSKIKNPKSKTPKERLKIMVEHTKLFEKTFLPGKRNGNGIKNFAVMKKHFKAYVSGWEGAKELRVKLMRTESFKEVNKIVEDYINK